jgi:hypothetical protein
MCLPEFPTRVDLGPSERGSRNWPIYETANYSSSVAYSGSIRKSMTPMSRMIVAPTKQTTDVRIVTTVSPTLVDATTLIKV